MFKRIMRACRAKDRSRREFLEVVITFERGPVSFFFCISRSFFFLFFLFLSYILAEVFPRFLIRLFFFSTEAFGSSRKKACMLLGIFSLISEYSNFYLDSISEETPKPYSFILLFSIEICQHALLESNLNQTVTKPRIERKKKKKKNRGSTPKISSVSKFLQFLRQEEQSIAI